MNHLTVSPPPHARSRLFFPSTYTKHKVPVSFVIEDVTLDFANRLSTQGFVPTNPVWKILEEGLAHPGRGLTMTTYATRGKQASSCRWEVSEA
jgi:hypothetical protein